MAKPLTADMLKALAADFKSVDEFSDRLKAFIYGPKGVGKTVTAAVFGKKLLAGTDKEVLFIDTSDGYRSIQNHPELLEGIRFMPYKSFSRVNFLAQAIAERKAPFDNVGVIVLDEASTMSDRHMLAKIQAERYPDLDVFDYPVPDWPDYRKLAAHWLGLLQFMYADANLHVIMVSHEREKSKDNVIVKDAIPSMTPAVFAPIAQDMDLVVRQTSTQKRIGGEWEYVREFQAWPTKKIEAKTRVGNLPMITDMSTLVKTTIEWLNRDQSAMSVEETGYTYTKEDGLEDD